MSQNKIWAAVGVTGKKPVGDDFQPLQHCVGGGLDRQSEYDPTGYAASQESRGVCYGGLGLAGTGGSFDYRQAVRTWEFFDDGLNTSFFFICENVFHAG